MTEPKYAERTSFRSNENVDVLVGLSSSLTNPAAPDVKELNNTDLFRNIVGIAPFSDMTFPAATASATSDDGPVINQAAGVSTPGTGAYQGDKIGTYLAMALKEKGSTQGWFLNIMDSVKYDKKGIEIFIVTRVAQSKEHDRQPFKVGDWVSVFKFKIVATNNATAGGAGYRVIPTFITAGEMHINTFVTDGTTLGVVTVAKPSAMVAGTYGQFRATAYGHDVTTLVDWISTDTSVLTIDGTGLAYFSGAGTVPVSTSHVALADHSDTITVTEAPAATVTTESLTVAQTGGEVSVAGTGLVGTHSIVLNGDTLYDWVPTDTEVKLYIPAQGAKSSSSLVVTTSDGVEHTIPLTVS